MIRACSFHEQKARQIHEISERVLTEHGGEFPCDEATLKQLDAMLPPPYAVEINRLLVPFGKHICTGRQPRCSTCPVLASCRQVGVTTHT